MNEQTIQQDLLAEIALLTRSTLENLNADDSFRENGLDSLSFIALLVFIRKKWGLNFLEKNLSSQDVSSPSALAKKIAQELES